MSESTQPATLETQESQPTSRTTQQVKTERAPGTTILPLARIKRVIKEDKDVSLINAEATFCIAYATELFMENLVTEAFTKAKVEKRKTVYYRDLADTVKEIEQFEFLEDVIPPTMTLKQAMEKRKETLNDDTPLPTSKKQKTTTKDQTEEDVEEAVEEEEEEDVEEEEEEEETVQEDDDEEMEDPK